MTCSAVPPVSAIADVLALWGDDGWLTPPLRPVVGASVPTIGRALTITITFAPTGPGLEPIFELLSGDLTGRMLVLAGAAAVPGAVWGELLTRAARQRGASGVLVDGWVRDRPEMAAIGFPVYAIGEHVVGPNGQAQLTHIDTTVTVNEVCVAADDMIVVDAGGCVRLRAATADAVLHAARRYSTAEDLVARSLAEGEPLARAYHHKKSIVDELRR